MELIWLFILFTAGSSTKAAAARVENTSTIFSVDTPVTVRVIIYPIITAMQMVSMRPQGMGRNFL